MACSNTVTLKTMFLAAYCDQGLHVHVPIKQIVLAKLKKRKNVVFNPKFSYASLIVVYCLCWLSTRKECRLWDLDRYVFFSELETVLTWVFEPPYIFSVVHT